MSDSKRRAAYVRRPWRLALLCLPVLVQAACRSSVGPPAVPAEGDSPPAAQVRPGGPGPKWTESERPQQFVGQDLYNYIDGGADLFLEMGFRRATVRRFSSGAATLIHDVYEMKDSTAARGIYFRFRGRGTPVAGVVGRNFGNHYQIAAQKDRYFVQITNASGEERCLPAMVKLVNQATAAVPTDEDVSVLELLPTEGLAPNSEALVCGPVSLQSVFTLGEGDVLQLQGRRCGIAGDYATPQEGRFTRLIVPYEHSEVARATFQHLLQALDPQLEVLRRSEHTVVFRDTNGEYGCITVMDDKLDIRLHLVRQPGGDGPSAGP